MSDQNIDFDSDEFENTPRALRDHVKKLERRLAETTKDRDTLRVRVTQAALGDVLKDYKNPKRVQRDLASDGVDPLDSEAVSAWLEENGDDYAKGAVSTPSTPDVADPNVAAQQRVNGADLTSPADMTRIDAFNAEVTPDMTGEDIKKLAAKHGL